MITQVVMAGLALLGGAAAQGAAAAENQLETARLTQAAQRAEFGVEGETSAFKFSFSDSVRIPTLTVPRSLCTFRSYVQRRSKLPQFPISNQHTLLWARCVPIKRF